MLAKNSLWIFLVSHFSCEESKRGKGVERKLIKILVIVVIIIIIIVVVGGGGGGGRPPWTGLCSGPIPTRNPHGGVYPPGLSPLLGAALHTHRKIGENWKCNEYWLIGWRKNHISVKCQRYMTFTVTPPINKYSLNLHFS